MANQVSNKATQRQQNAARQERIRRYNAEKADALKIFASVFGATLLIAIITLIVTLCSHVVYVHNTAMTENGGQEVWVRGSAFLKALFSGTYTSADAGYDNLAVPFYYYAKAYCQPAALLTLFSVVSAVLTIFSAALSLVMAIWKKEYLFTFLTLVFSVLTTVLIFVLFGIALSMANGDILTTYCNNNPACSIRSDVIWGAILSLLTVAANIFAVIKFVQIEKVRKS